MEQDGIGARVLALLDEIQDGLFQKALAHRAANVTTVDSYDAFKAAIEKGGFVLAPWDGSAETEAQIKEETKATIRCLPLPGQFDGQDERRHRPPQWQAERPHGALRQSVMKYRMEGGTDGRMEGKCILQLSVHPSLQTAAGADSSRAWRAKPD